MSPNFSRHSFGRVLHFVALMDNEASPAPSAYFPENPVTPLVLLSHK